MNFYKGDTMKRLAGIVCIAILTLTVVPFLFAAFDEAHLNRLTKGV